jgi:predicted Rossmann-fold nucleotide-binding protein
MPTDSLPSCAPKPQIDDPEAPARVKALLESPAFVRADDDSAFLRRDDLRSCRLQLEYLKTELALQEQGIQSTIVLFGGTRISEPSAAARALTEAECYLAECPDDPARKRKLAVAKSLAAKSKYYDVAREFAALVSRACAEERPGEYVIVTGGGPGIMEAGNRGAFDARRATIGLNITLPMEQFPNPYISPELCFQFRYFALRKLHFIKRAKALVAFPGGYGTLDELFDAPTSCSMRCAWYRPARSIRFRSYWSARAFGEGPSMPRFSLSRG